MSEPLPLPGFDDGKDPAALRTIGEVAAGFGIRQHVLRYWEQQFPMLRPLKRSGGRRYYRPEDLALVETINRLINQEGYTLKGARQAIERRTAAASPGASGSASAGHPAETGGSTGGEPGTSGQAGTLISSRALDPALVVQLRAIRQRLADALG